MLLSGFIALGPISMPTPPTVALAEFFHVDTVPSVYPLPVSWYLISTLCVYLCSCMHIMYILCSTANAVSCGSWPILFNVAIWIVCLHFSSFFLFELCSWFFEHCCPVSNLSRTSLFFTRAKSDAVYVCSLSVDILYIFTCLPILVRTCFFFWHWGLSLFLCFFLNYYGVGFCGDSKLLEKTLPCTEHASTFDRGHTLNLDLR